MKKNTLIALTTALLLGLTQIGHAGYVGGFKVVEASDSQVVIQKGEAEPVTVKIEAGKYKVGDVVNFDADKLRLKKAKKKTDIEGC